MKLKQSVFFLLLMLVGVLFIGLFMGPELSAQDGTPTLNIQSIQQTATALAEAINNPQSTPLPNEELPAVAQTATALFASVTTQSEQVTPESASTPLPFEPTMIPALPDTGLFDNLHAPTTNTSPTWSPDGQLIAFASDGGGERDFEIYIIGADGHNLRQLTNNVVDDIWPSWSADSQRLVFASERDGNLEIYTMRIDGSDVKQLTFTN